MFKRILVLHIQSGLTFIQDIELEIYLGQANCLLYLLQQNLSTPVLSFTEEIGYPVVLGALLPPGFCNLQKSRENRQGREHREAKELKLYSWIRSGLVLTSAELLSWYIKMHDEFLFIMSKCFEMKGDSLMLSGLCFSVSLRKCFQKYF